MPPMLEELWRWNEREEVSVLEQLTDDVEVDVGGDGRPHVVVSGAAVAAGVWPGEAGKLQAPTLHLLLPPRQQAQLQHSQSVGPGAGQLHSLFKMCKEWKRWKTILCTKH